MNHDDHDGDLFSDNDLRTAQALFDLQTIIADQQKLIDYLTEGYRSHHAAILAQAEDLDHALFRLELLEAQVSHDE